MPQPKVSDSLAVVLKNIQVPENVATSIADSIKADRGSIETASEKELSSLNQRLQRTQTLMDNLCEERLLGNVPDGANG